MVVIIYSFNAKEIIKRLRKINRETRECLYGILIFKEADFVLDRISKSKEIEEEYNDMLKRYYGLDDRPTYPVFKGGLATLVGKEAFLKFHPLCPDSHMTNPIKNVFYNMFYVYPHLR